MRRQCRRLRAPVFLRRFRRLSFELYPSCRGAAAWFHGFRSPDWIAERIIGMIHRFELWEVLYGFRFFLPDARREKAHLTPRHRYILWHHLASSRRVWRHIGHW